MTTKLNINIKGKQNYMLEQTKSKKIVRCIQFLIQIENTKKKPCAKCTHSI